MNNRRTVQKLSSIIDLLNHDSAGLIGKGYIRILYEYDRTEDRQKFTVIDGKIAKESADRIVSWLESNVAPEDIIYGLKSNELDIKSLKFNKKAA